MNELNRRQSHFWKEMMSWMMSRIDVIINVIDNRAKISKIEQKRKTLSVFKSKASF